MTGREKKCLKSKKIRLSSTKKTEAYRQRESGWNAFRGLSKYSSSVTDQQSLATGVNLTKYANLTAGFQKNPGVFCFFFKQAFILS